MTHACEFLIEGKRQRWRRSRTKRVNYLPEREMRYRNILQSDVKFPSSGNEVLPDPGTNDFSLRNQLSGIKLGDNTLQNFVPDRRDDPLVVVQSEGLINFRKSVDVWAEKNTEGDGDHL